MMNEAVLMVYELATAFVPFLVAYALVHARASRSGAWASGLVGALAFAVYVFAVLDVTGIGTVYDVLRTLSGYAPVDKFTLRLPLSEGISLGVVLNGIMFMPLGLLLPLVWHRGARLLPVVGFGFAFSLAIELSQLLNNRTTDVDDLFMNTLGALVGFLLFKLWERIRARRVQGARPGRHAAPIMVRPVLPGLAEPALYVASMFAGMFLLYNGLGAAAVLYGF